MATPKNKKTSKLAIFFKSLGAAITSTPLVAELKRFGRYCQRVHERIWFTNVRVDLSMAQDGSDVRLIRRKRSGLIPAVLLGFGLTLVCFVVVISGIDRIMFNWHGIGSIITALFTPKWTGTVNWDGWRSYCWNTGFRLVWRTVEMCFLATVVGSLISVPLYYLSAHNIAKSPWVYQPVRIVNDFIRTIPTLVLAVLATCFFGLTNLSGIVAMTIFTVGIMYKLMYEYIETLEMSPFEAISSSGARTLQSVNLGLHPEIKPMFFSYFLYTFEINIRASVILGFVGAGGIGTELENQITALCYDKVGALLVPLFLVVCVLQITTNVTSRKLR
jgi:phosphonate transport system permease protein